MRAALRGHHAQHQTARLRPDAGQKFPAIVAKLAGMVHRFCTMLDCVDVGFLPDGILDQLPLPSQIGATKVGGVDLNKPRLRTTLAAVLALAVAPGGFTIADLTSKVHTMAGDTTYTRRQGAYDLRKLRGKQLVDKPGRSRRYHVPPSSARTIAALVTLRDQVIAPILAGVRSHGDSGQPAHWTATDRAHAALRSNMEILFGHIRLNTA
jgi:hypothetical protein